MTYVPQLASCLFFSSLFSWDSWESQGTWAHELSLLAASCALRT